MGGGGNTIMRLMTSIRAAPFGALLALAAGGLGGCISTATYGTGEAPETTLLREATGGVFNKLDGKAEAAVDYEPRAPLVVPPVAQLPQPSPAPSQRAAGNWPTDYDQVQDEERRVLAETEQTRAMGAGYTRRLKTLAGIMGGDRTQLDAAEERRRKLHARDPAKAFLTERDSRKEFQAALAEAEGLDRTERRYLTDPPSAYREPAETAPAQFEDIQKKRKGFFARIFGG
jgi:hypothetical protein